MEKKNNSDLWMLCDWMPLLSRVTLCDLSRKWTKPLSGGARLAVSCLAPARTFSRRWQGGCPFPSLPLGQRLSPGTNSEHPPGTSRAWAGSPWRYRPLEDIPHYSVIHHLHKPSNRFQSGANWHHPRLHQSLWTSITKARLPIYYTQFWNVDTCGAIFLYIA